MRASLRELNVGALTYNPMDTIDGLPRIVVGLLEGGKSPSRTSELCVARGDIRIGPGMTQETLLADVRRIIGRLREEDPDLVAEVRGLTYQRPFRISPEAAIVRAVRLAHADISGTEAVVSAGLPVSGYVTDS